MSSISTHILDTALGRPAANVSITLSKQDSEHWQTIGSGKTNQDGRVPDLCEYLPSLVAGTYKIHFDTKAYFLSMKNPIFYPYAEVVFMIDYNQQHYHIPLLLSPFGYSTYRGS